MISACSDRFERRLVEEIAGVRVQIAQTEATLRGDLRQEMTTLGAGLRQEMGSLGVDLRKEMASDRFELLKWCFLFWIGQVLAITGIMGVMLRLTSRF